MASDGRLDITNYQIDIIGTGLQSPNIINPVSGSINYNTGIKRINQSIHHILGTRVGTRFFLPEFGSKLYSLIFEPNDDILKELLILYIKEALSQWEPRICDLQIDPQVKIYENTVPVSIGYRLINTNILGNYVYPFNRQVYEVSSFYPSNEGGF